MPRLTLTWLGALALLFAAPPQADAAELVRSGATPHSVAPIVEAPTHGALPREEAWADQGEASPVGTGAAAEPTRLDGEPTQCTDAAPAPQTCGPAARHDVLPDARAPPA